MRCADEHSVPAGSALAVDRHQFAQAVTTALSNHPLVEVIHEEVCEIPQGPTVIAGGPLISASLSDAIAEMVDSGYFYFY